MKWYSSSWQADNQREEKRAAHTNSGPSVKLTNQLFISSCRDGVNKDMQKGVVWSILKSQHIMVVKSLCSRRGLSGSESQLHCASMLSQFSHVQLSVMQGLQHTHQVPLSMGFSRQEYWNGLPFPLPVDLPDLGVEPTAPTMQVNSLPLEPPGKPLYLATRE